MIGVYDYTVLLTYLSLLAASTGILVSLSGNGHPYLGVFFLLVCGLCDAFDGKVARMKKDRNEMERNFGIQIDSLSDLVAFGVLPACIGAAMIRNSPMLNDLFDRENWFYNRVLQYILFAILIVYVLAAMIRLAYFNVTEEIRQKNEGGVRKFYTGLPVTSAALIFPVIVLIKHLFQHFLQLDITLLYLAIALLTGFAFLAKFKVKKFGLKGILIMVAIGTVEFLLLLLFLIPTLTR